MPTLPHMYLIALGSNLGDRAGFLAAAAAAVGRELGPVRALAGVYETAPVGAADRRFLNSAAVVASALAPDAALAALLGIETAMGRVRAEHWGNRVIDLDLLLWRDADGPADAPGRTWQSPGLTLPHPRMLERDFVLVPACAVAAAWRHPQTGRTLQDECAARGFHLVEYA